MKIIKETSPYIRKKSSVTRMMIDVLIALIPVVIFSLVQYGLKALSVLLISIATMLICEIVFVFITRQNPYDGKKKSIKEKIITAYKNSSINNITAPLISAIIYALIMPAGTNWYVVLIGAMGGMVLGKLLFGGLGSNIFNPAALGRVISMICFDSITYLPILGLNNVDVFAGGTPLYDVVTTLASQDTITLFKNLLIGTIPGSMGEVSKLCIIAGGVYLIVRRSADYRPMFAMIGTFMLLMLVAGFKAEGINPLSYMLYQTLTGGLLFGAVFMITDPITSPTTRPGRITFGIFVGILSVLIRLIGGYPEGVAFAILIMNMFVPVIDYYKWSTNKYSYKHIIFWLCILILSATIVYFGATVAPLGL